MALFHIVLKGWISAFGDGEVTVRLLSAILGVAAVPVVYVLGRRLFGHTAAVAAALLLAVNAFFIAYAQEARSYALLLLLVCASSYLALRLLDGERKALLALAYAVVTALAVGAHVFAVFIVPAHLVAALVAARSGRALVAPTLGAAGALALSSPVVLTIVAQDAGQIGWIIKPSVLDLGLAGRDLVGGNKWLFAAYAALCAVALLPLVRARATGADRRATGIVLAWLVVPVLASVAVSYLIQPVLAPRYLILCLPALVLLAGRGLASLPRWPALAATAAVLALAGFALPYFQSDYEEVNFRDATGYLLSQARPGDGIVFYRPSRRLGFEYYQAHSEDRTPALVPVFPRSRFGSFDLTDDYRALRPSASDYARMAAWARDRRVWLFSSQEDFPENRSTAARIQATLGGGGTLRGSREFTNLRVRLYEPPTG